MTMKQQSSSELISIIVLVEAGDQFPGAGRDR